MNSDTAGREADDWDRRMQRAAQAMRAAFFAEFPLPEPSDAAGLDRMVRMLAALHCGELLEWAARFVPNRPIDETILVVVRAMLADPANRAELDEVRGASDPMAFLSSHQVH